MVTGFSCLLLHTICYHLLLYIKHRKKMWFSTCGCKTLFHSYFHITTAILFDTLLKLNIFSYSWLQWGTDICQLKSYTLAQKWTAHSESFENLALKWSMLGNQAVTSSYSSSSVLDICGDNGLIPAIIGQTQLKASFARVALGSGLFRVPEWWLRH